MFHRLHKRKAAPKPKRSVVRGFLSFKRYAKGFLSFKRSACGFTLAELLISLAILGVIAVFAIPKILQAAQDNQKQAVAKETGAAFENLTEIYRRNPPGPANWTAFMHQHINAVRFCDSDASTEGCWTSGMVPDESTENGFILPNGAYVYGMFGNSVNWDSFVVDWNGPAPPNQFGEDSYYLVICLDANGCVDGGTGYGTGQNGTILHEDEYVRLFNGN